VQQLRWLVSLNECPYPAALCFGYSQLTCNVLQRVITCRDEQLAKFEAYLNKEGCLHINALVRSRSRMAYPMKG
jgi:hypothetical protein